VASWAATPHGTDGAPGNVVLAGDFNTPDHPVVLGVPETYYLKCFVLRKLE